MNTLKNLFVVNFGKADYPILRPAVSPDFKTEDFKAAASIFKSDLQTIGQKCEKYLTAIHDYQEAVCLLEYMDPGMIDTKHREAKKAERIAASAIYNLNSRYRALTGGRTFLRGLISKEEVLSSATSVIMEVMGV